MAESNQYDIVFILDKSGSMGYYINEVKNNVASFVNLLKTRGVDVQLGLVEYEDISNTKKYDLTKNVDTFISNVNSIRTTGGTEYGLTALTDSPNGALSLNFRENSNREFILVTDEGYQENNSSYYASKSAITDKELIAKLQQNNVKLDVFGELNSAGYSNYYSYYGVGTCQDEWTPIAEATTGKYINGDPAKGKFYDINTDFSLLLRDVVGEKVLDGNGTHQLAFAQWSYGFTPNSENNASDTTPIIAPSA